MEYVPLRPELADAYDSTGQILTPGIIELRNALQSVVTERLPRVIDLGSGEGRNAKWLAENGNEVTALDSDQNIVSRAIGSASLRFVYGHIEQPAFPAHSFEAVLSALALHQLYPQSKISVINALQRMRQLTVPRGYNLVDLYVGDNDERERTGNTSLLDYDEVYSLYEAGGWAIKGLKRFRIEKKSKAGRTDLNDRDVILATAPS